MIATGPEGPTVWILETGPLQKAEASNEVPAQSGDRPDAATATQPVLEAVKPEATTPLVLVPAESKTVPTATYMLILSARPPKQDRN